MRTTDQSEFTRAIAERLPVRISIQSSEYDGYLTSQSADWVAIAVTDTGLLPDGHVLVKRSLVDWLEIPGPGAVLMGKLQAAGRLVWGDAVACQDDVSGILRAAAQTYGVFSVRLDGEEDACNVGVSAEVSDGVLRWLEVDPDGILDEEVTEYAVGRISRIDFGTSYLAALNQVLKHREDATPIDDLVRRAIARQVPVRVSLPSWEVDGYITSQSTEWLALAVFHDWRTNGRVLVRKSSIEWVQTPSPSVDFLANLATATDFDWGEPVECRESVAEMLLEAARKHGLVAIETDDRSDIFHVGVSPTIVSGRLSWREVTPEGALETEVTEHPLDRIHRIGVGGGYLRALALVLES